MPAAKPLRFEHAGVIRIVARVRAIVRRGDFASSPDFIELLAAIVGSKRGVT